MSTDGPLARLGTALKKRARADYLRKLCCFAALGYALAQEAWTIAAFLVAILIASMVISVKAARTGPPRSLTRVLTVLLTGGANISGATIQLLVGGSAWRICDHLDQLEEDGWITRTIETSASADRPPHHYYALTRYGRAQALALLNLGTEAARPGGDQP
ncbi:helix-turn-helix transcriptional regulator [Nonomuraea typhae]|uniref:helix-turn-helix transcriptional regulator n=1 Tax=Nonomuraea typhae TaxID=2603600 RepID=UPI0012F91526|nr:helix-turn-helix transcriptional regulator [Nonomuraea typhae]